MIALILAVVLNTICFIRLRKERGKPGYKLGAWIRWREYYPTILYIILGNLAYFYVFHDYELWIYSSFLGNIFIGLIIVFLIYPPMVALYLAHFPEGILRKIFYVLGWTTAGVLLELLAYITGGMYYDHGWNLFWSSVVFAGTFVLLKLHHKRPLIVWPISLACGIAVAIIFGLPVPK